MRSVFSGVPGVYSFNLIIGYLLPGRLQVTLLVTSHSVTCLMSAGKDTIPNMVLNLSSPDKSFTRVFKVSSFFFI